MMFRNIKHMGMSLSLLAALWMAACSSAASSAGNTPPATTPALPASMKGYELYSWQTDGDWHFTLMTGTNRAKTLEEITEGPDSVTADGWVRVSAQSVDALKQLLSRLPPDETIVWIGERQLEQTGVEPGAIELPPQEIIDSISETCRQLQLELLVSDNPGGTGGRRHQVFNIGMELPAIRAIVEAVNALLPEGIGVEYGEGYVP